MWYVHGLSRVFPSLSSKQITMPVGVLAFVCSFWFFKNSLQLLNLNRIWPAFALIFELFLSLLLFMIMRSKEGSAAADFTSVEQWQKNGSVRIVCKRVVLRFTRDAAARWFPRFRNDAEFSDRHDIQL
jgi:hypothetical protein